MLTCTSLPTISVPSALRSVIVTSAWLGPCALGSSNEVFNGSVVVVAARVIVPLWGEVNEPPSPPPPPQLARARLASSSPRVLPKNFMWCLQAC